MTTESNELAAIVARELAEYAQSANPIKEALLALYQDGLIHPLTAVDGEVIWSAIP